MTVTELYAEADRALNVDNDSDASLLQSQADQLYQITENLAALIVEQEE